MIIFRLLTLFLLWQYIKDEYKGINDESLNFSNNDDDQSTTNSIA